MIESTEKYCRNPWSYNFANPSIRGRGPGGGGFGILYARAKIGPQALAFLTLEADGKSNRRDGLAQVSYRIVRDRLASTLAFFDHHLEALKVHEERLMLVQQDDKLDAQERDGECLLIRHEIAECMWKSNSFSLRKAALKEQRGISREAESRYGSDSAFVCRAKMKILKMSLMEKDPSLDEETQRIYESLLQTFQTNDRGRHRLRIIALQNEYAYYLYTRGREREDLDLGDKATAIQEEAYALQVRIYGEDNDQSMTALNNLVSMIAISTNAKSRAHEIIEKSRKIFTWRQKHLGNSHHRTLQAMDNLSLALQEHGDINEALSLILLSIETRIPLIRIGDMDDKQMRSTLTLMRDAVGLLEKDTDEGRANSQNFLKKAIASMSRFEHSNPAGNEYWDVMNYYRQEYAKALRNMAKQHEAHREFDKSIPLRQEALNETLRIEEECRHYVKDHWRGLAQAYFRSGKRFLDPRKGQSADESFTRALDLLCIHESPTADETLGMRRQIAHLLEDHEQHWKAALLRRENLVLLLEQGTETGAIAQAAESLVGTLAGQAKRNLRYREYEAAILLLAECVDVASTHLGRTHQVTFVCRGKLAGAHSQAGNADMAVSIMNAAAIDAREVEDINPGLTKQLQDFLTKMRDRHGQNVEVTK
ncbi:hypothetical protein K491DRAFT_294568 [Lophiostoma macrostomum CBS 122681]|uniref:TPR-like protein n=1 Tax=Lophiostoma macrostomum CBS 122681 TaxID=1314788 RepID=A0A6A6TF86_9PLEO|nr:hypothetical protein K491DRAFT_294568 [Lophiostoma macrostomum CBS 122681]